MMAGSARQLRGLAKVLQDPNREAAAERLTEGAKAMQRKTDVRNYTGENAQLMVGSCAVS